MGFWRANAPWLGAGALMALGSSFGQTFFISVFAAGIMGDFDLTPGTWGAIYASGTTASAVVMLWAGGLADRFRTRVLLGWTLVGLATACLMMAVNTLWILLPVTVFLLRLFGQGMMTHLSRVSISRWFQARRGRALALSTLGFAVGEAMLPVAAVAAMTVLGWRDLWFMAAIACLAMIPVFRRLLRHERTPQGHAEDLQTTGLGGRDWRRAEVLRAPVLWLLVPSIMLPGAFATAFFFHQVQLAEDLGLSHLSFVALFPLYTALSVACTLASGWAIDRFGSLTLMPVYQLALAGCFTALASMDGTAAAMTALVLLGISTGANNTVPTTFLAEMFGTRFLGAIKAMAMALMVLGSALGPLVTGLAMDAGWTLEAQAGIIAAIVVAGCGATATSIYFARRRYT